MIRHRLNRTFTVRRPTLAGDGAGGYIEQLVEVGTIRAQVSQPSAKERVAAQQVGATLTHVAHAEARANVERGDRLDDGKQTLRVVAVVQDSRATYKRLECEAEQDG